MNCEPPMTNTEGMGTEENQEFRMSSWGSYRPHAHLSLINVGNAVLCVTALLPSIFMTWLWYTRCDRDFEHVTNLWTQHCSLALEHPIWMANVLFFTNVAVGFWVVGLLQRSFWLIDPYWTLIPPLLVHFYALNPLATANPMRSNLSVVLVLVWSARLTYSYFRREEFKFGQREDWRYTKMAEDYPASWPVLSFFAVGLAQQPMLVGISLPAFSVHRSDTALSSVDLLAVACCVTGLSLAYVADTELHRFMTRNEEMEANGEAKVPVLRTGVWAWSRHPNYVGETLWWFGYGLFGVAVGHPWVLAGWALNTAVLVQVTHMTEARMRNNRTGERLDAFVAYCEECPCWVGPRGAAVTQRRE